MSSATLYGEQIVYLSKHPKNFRAIENPNYMCEGANPLCGDKVTVYVNVDDGGAVSDIAFQGVGCAICIASASMMTAAVKGKRKEDIDTLFHEFHKMVKGELDVEKEPNHLGKLAMFSNVSNYPVRVKCASLPWHAMHNALEQKKDASTE